MDSPWMNPSSPRLALDLHGAHLPRHRAKHLQRRQRRWAPQQEALAQHQGATGEVGVGDQQLLGKWGGMVTLDADSIGMIW